MFEVKGKFATAKVYADMIEEEAVGQITTLCNQPMFENAQIAIMPDCHSGKGSVIGFTAVLDTQKVIPNIVGVDIGCGVNTTIFKTEKDIDFEKLDTFIRSNIPSGFKKRNRAHPMLLENKGLKDEIKRVSEIVNDNYKKHFLSLGTLGGGNHYIEIGKTDNGEHALSIHTGSRNLGNLVCRYYQSLAEKHIKKQISWFRDLHKTAKTTEEHEEINKKIAAVGNSVPKELRYLEGDDFFAYMRDMKTMNEFACFNRKIIAAEILTFLQAEVLEQFETIHNYVEEDDGKFIIRKGAIRARLGEKVAIPLNMKDGVLVGTGKGNEAWNCSAPHGAGRLMSRKKAKEAISLKEFEESMQGVNTWSVNQSTIDEAPQAYKPANYIKQAIGDTVEIAMQIKPVYNFKAN